MIKSPNINVMTAAARKAARGLVRDFGEVEQLQVSQKGTSDFVTAADLKCEKILRQELSKARPTWGFLLEEAGEIKGDEDAYRWIIDPLDGTTNFIHGIPHFAISIGLQTHTGEIVAGVVYNPITDEMFVAEKGAGAFLNDRRLRTSGRKKLEDSVIATGIPHKGRGEHASYLRQLSYVMANTAGIRRFGAASLDLAYVAAGRCDAFWETGLAPWDIAAGSLLVREAGGWVSDTKGNPGYIESGDILACNNPLHPSMVLLLKKATSA